MQLLGSKPSRLIVPAVYRTTLGHFIQGSTHTHTYTQTACCRGRQGCDNGQGRNASLRAQLHMSVTYSCCQDQHHHLLEKRGSRKLKMGRCQKRRAVPEVVRVFPMGHQYIFMCVNEHQRGMMCASVLLCQKAPSLPSLSQQPSKTRAQLHISFITARMKVVETVQEHLSVPLCSWQTRVSWSSVRWMDQQDF